MRYLLLIVAALLIGCAPLAQTITFLPAVFARRDQITYLPLILSEPDCVMDERATEFFTLLTRDSRQQRALACNPALVKAARSRAESLVTGGLWGHVDPNGTWANDYARVAGCALPPHYGTRNNIESIAAGSPYPRALYDALGASEGHAVHLFGLLDFYRGQHEAGIAYADGSRWGPVVVVMIAECE